MLTREPQQLGNYQIIRMIGQGGFATVYLGKHIHLGNLAAVKVLHPRFVDEGLISQFRQEARIIADLSHPHIVRVLDFNVESHTTFFVMDYAPAGSLRDQHPLGSIVPLPTVVSYVKQVAEALHYAHHQRVIHRDVKPENMLIGRNGEILLSDFGLALPTEISRTQDAAGTIGYMAPEQIDGKPRAASDQYSLAITVYEWLCGHRPFSGSVAEVMNKHLSADPPPLSLSVSISPQLEEVVLRGLAKDPSERFPTVMGFAQALQTAAGVKSPRLSTIAPAQYPKRSRDLGNTRTVQGPPERPPRSKSRSRLLVRRTLLLSLAGLATVGVVGIAFAAMHQSSPTVVQLPSTPSSPTTAVQPTATQVQASPTPQPSTPTPNPTPVGTLATTLLDSTTVFTDAWSPDGKRIISGNFDHLVQIWDATSGNALATYQGHTAPVLTVAWSPDGTRLASGSNDRTVQVRGIGGNALFSCVHDDQVQSVAWSPDGRRIASGSDDLTVRVWDAMDGTLLMVYRDHQSPVRSITWSPDGTKIASASGIPKAVSGDSTVKIWDTITGQTQLTYQGHTATVNSVAWSPDGTRLASGSDDTTVHIWNAVTGHTQLTYQGHINIVHSVAWSPGGHRVVSGSEDTTVQIWNAITGAPSFTYRGHSDVIFAVAWSPDGQHIASASNDHTIQVWQAL